MAELHWEPEAAAAYSSLDEQPRRLADAIDDVLDQLEADPGDQAMRRRSRRTRTGDVIWKIDIRRGVEDWTLLWIEHPEITGDALIVYLGPAQYE
jgi:hypothetical protein